MASFLENIQTIETAVYGKEMRPAIKEALLQSRDLVDKMESQIKQLNSRVDAFSGSGDDTGGGGAIVVDTIQPPIIVVYGALTKTGCAGIPVDA